MENTRTVRIQNGVAVIPVSGVITGRMDFLTYVLGGTALDILAKDFRTALENSDIRAIILDFDSPGGIAVGPAEMADMIFNAREASQSSHMLAETAARQLIGLPRQQIRLLHIRRLCSAALVW